MKKPADRHNLEVSFVNRVGDIPDALWTECFPPPLEGRFWYQALEGSRLEDQFTFFYALITRDGEHVGIAPCFLHNVPLSLVAPQPVARVLHQLSRIWERVGYQRTLFVGSPCSDEGTIGLVRGVDLDEILAGLHEPRLAKARECGAPMIVFKDFAKASLPSFKRHRWGRKFVPTVSYPGCLLELAPPNKEAYFRCLSHNQRHNFLKKLRRSREILDLETTVVERPTDGELAEIFELFSQTYVRGKTKFERLGLPFFEQISMREPARFILQRERTSGELIAFRLVFCVGDRVINKFIGLNYLRSGKSFLYFRLFEAAIDFAYSRGATEIQSGQTAYRAKLDLGHRLVPLVNVFRHKNFLVHFIFGSIGRRITWRSLDKELAAPEREPIRAGIC